MRKSTYIRWLLTIPLLFWIAIAEDLLPLKFCLIILTVANEANACLWEIASQKGREEE